RAAGLPEATGGARPSDRSRSERLAGLSSAAVPAGAGRVIQAHDSVNTTTGSCNPQCHPSGAVVAVALADDLDVLRLGSLLALGDVELDLLPLVEAAVAATGDRAEVHEHIWATFDLDETVA